jgi:glycosyltransferase involved in cell wall biosynthesis
MINKIGVLMSVYRADEPYHLRLALESVLDQQLPWSAEVHVYLCVDGPVSDELREVIQEFAPQIYRIVWAEHNQGLAQSLNTLISIREDEEFYFRMDADDLSLPGRFARQIDHMRQHPEVDILGTALLEVDRDQGVRRVIHYASSPAHASRMIARRVPVAHPTVCFRAGVFKAVSGYPTAMFPEDVAMWFACMTAGLVFDNLREPCYEFRVGSMHQRRRGAAYAWSEFRTYSAGLWKLKGVTWRYLFPMARLLSRLMPVRVQEWLYASPLR